MIDAQHSLHKSTRRGTDKTGPGGCDDAPSATSATAYYYLFIDPQFRGRLFAEYLEVGIGELAMEGQRGVVRDYQGTFWVFTCCVQ